MRNVALISCWFALPVAALAQAPDASEVFTKGGVPPQIGIVEGVRDGKLLVREVMIIPTQRTRNRPVTVTETVNGVVQERTETVAETYTVMATTSRTVEHELSGVRVFDTSARPIPTDRLARLYERPGLALLAPAHLQIDPVYLRVARDSVPLIVLPPPPPTLPAPVPAAPVAPPAPTG